MARWTRLDDRGVLELGGADAVKLLQGLVSNDLDRLTREPAIYAALFATGSVLYGRTGTAMVLGIVAVGAAVGIARLLPRIGLR